jgi:hypothetical protein
MKPLSVEAPTRVQDAPVEGARIEVGPSTSQRAQDDEAGEAMLRRRARRSAFILMTLSAVFVIALVGTGWLLLHG